MSNTNLVEGLHFFSTSDEDSKSGSDIDYAFMVTTLITSYAHVAESPHNAWFADRGASKHITDRHDWFTILEFIPKGRHIIHIAHNIKLWVWGWGTIYIKCLIDGQYQNGMLKNVIFVPHLMRNMFSVGLISERKFSFITYPDGCDFCNQHDKKLMERTQFWNLYQLLIQILPLHHPLAITLFCTNFLDITSSIDKVSININS